MAAKQDEQSEPKRLYLIDAMALAYRAHFIFISRPLINSKGQNTSASYGFTNGLIKLIEQHGMDHMVVVFDAVGEGGTFRDELYEEYKAHRAPMPDDLLANLPYIKRIVEALDIPVLEVPGVEADDVIGTLARRAAEEGADAVIVSPDKDFQQLLGPHVTICRPAHRGEEFDPITAETFFEKYGLEPEQFIDMLALMGDASDNVPGVPGIGEKTAMKLLQDYGTVENLLTHAGEVSGKRAREGLLAHKSDALLSKQLATIKTDLDVPVDWHRFRRSAPDVRQLTALFTELEFGSLLNRVQNDALIRRGDAAPVEPAALPASADPALAFDFGPYEEVRQIDRDAVDYRVVRSRADLERLAGELAGQEWFSFDTETTSTDAMWASLVGMSFAWEAGRAVYVPTPLPDGTSTEEALRLLTPHFRKLVGQNLKYDLLVLARHGARVEAELFDTMVAHYLLQPEEPHGLDALARAYLSYRMIPITDLIGTGRNQKSMRDVEIDLAAEYACEDADVTLQLAERLRADLEESGLRRIAETIEFPLISVLVDMELAGIRVDTKILAEISEQLDTQIRILEHDIHDLVGEPFNIGSTQQLSEILFERLGLRVVAKTSTGRPSTKENVLEELSTEHPMPGLILDWRRLAKLKSTYVDSLGGLVHPETGRIHTSFNQTIAATGRLSSSHPNLQNIPVRTDLGREIRKAFVAAEGTRLLAADYVQIELRILAAMSGDEALKQAFRDGRDIHTEVAARIFGVAPEDVARDQRRKAKEVNYGIPYGVSAWGLAQRLRSGVQEAQQIIDQYQRSYTGVSRFLAETVERARERGYVETLLGRRRYVPDINARNATQRSFAERVAVNMPIQGTQADMIKIAMVRIARSLNTAGLKTRLLLQVHDELVFEVPEAELETVRPIIEKEMVNALPLDVPVEVDIDQGDNWLDAH